MELRCVQSPTLSGVPRNALSGIPYSCCRTIVSCPLDKRISSGATRFMYSDSRVRVKGTAIEKSKANYIVSSSDVGPKDDNLVFVAGATGKVGSRTVRELLKLGFKVRAGVRSVQRAASLVESVKNLKVENEGETQYVDMLELVECDLERADQISTALGNSSTVVCCIGASEKEILDTTGPYRIDYKATENLIGAATSAKVSHFILVTSLGTNKVGFPAAILNLFWGVLIWKRKAEEALLASGIPYTIVRPGGMERPTDSFKETHNITLSTEDTLFGGLVSNLQVAELLAFMAKNRSLSYCKVVEVVAETTAPLLPFEDLLNKIPSNRELSPPKSSEKIAAVSESTPELAKATSAGIPQSPYVCYEDLKPPTSPTPTTGSKLSNFTNNNVPAATPSPSPTEVDSSERPEILREATAPKEPKSTQPSSPYIKYHDLKPPSSPSPSAPI